MHDKLFNIIKGYTDRGAETPTLDKVARAAGIPASTARSIVREFREAGRVVVEYGKNGSIQRYTIDGHSTTLRPPAVKRGQYGDGPIARMKDRTVAEKLILAVFQGKLTEREAQKRAEKMR